MRSGYRKISRLLLLLLIFATAALFVYPMKDGKPLLSLNKLSMLSLPDAPLSKIPLPAVITETPAPVTVYKWQDKEGGWQFSNEPPPQGVVYQTHTLDPNANIMESVSATASSHSPETDTDTTTGDGAAFGYSVDEISRMMETTNRVKEAVEQRQQTRQGIIE